MQTTSVVFESVIRVQTSKEYDRQILTSQNLAILYFVSLREDVLSILCLVSLASFSKEMIAGCQINVELPEDVETYTKFHANRFGRCNRTQHHRRLNQICTIEVFIVFNGFTCIESEPTTCPGISSQNRA